MIRSGKLIEYLKEFCEININNAQKEEASLEDATFIRDGLHGACYFVDCYYANKEVNDELENQVSKLLDWCMEEMDKIRLEKLANL